MSHTRVGPVGGCRVAGRIGGSCWKVKPEWHGGERTGSQADGSCRGSTGHSCSPPTPTALSLRHSWLPHPWRLQEDLPHAVPKPAPCHMRPRSAASHPLSRATTQLCRQQRLEGPRASEGQRQGRQDTKAVPSLQFFPDPKKSEKVLQGGFWKPSISPQLPAPISLLLHLQLHVPGIYHAGEWSIALRTPGSSAWQSR